MKARLLKKLLNNTGYNVGDYADYIAVGSPLCHDLIKVMKKDYQMSYALSIKPIARHREDTSDKVREVWDGLAALIKSGELADIIAGNDELENPLPVFAVVSGEFVSTFTDEYGWPNTTQEGVIMHDNVYYPTAVEALKHGIKEQGSWLEMVNDRIAEYHLKIKEGQERAENLMGQIEKLQELLKQQ